MKNQLLFGTNNTNKLKEIREMLGESMPILSLQEGGIDLDVEETEATLEGNAILKAKTYFQLAQIPCFADDTGLEVEVLGGAPGVITARYAGPARKASENMAKLLSELEGRSQRTAQFRTVIAFFDGKELHTFEGKVKGEIAYELKGTQGFGYDPIFIPVGSTLSFAEMPAGEKHSISHRGRALKKLVDFLKEYGK